MITRRLAKMDDAGALFEIEKKYFHCPWTEPQFKTEIEENEFSKVMLLEDEGKIIGYIDYWIIFDQGQINKICIIEEYRRQHLAERLMQDALRDMKVNEVFSVSLEVRKSNESAQKLYEKMGFKTVVTKPNYYSDGEDAYYMLKGGYEL